MLTFGDYVFLGTEILQLKPQAVRRAAGDAAALGIGLAFIALAGIASALGGWRLTGLIVLPVFYVLAAFFVAFLLHLLATTVFGGQGEFLSLFRPFSLTYVLDWILAAGLLLRVVPFFGAGVMALAGLAVVLWKLVTGVIIVETVYGLDRTRAAGVVAVLFGLGLFLVLLVSMLFGAALISWLVLSRS